MWSLFGSVCEFFLIFGGQKWHKNMPKCIYFYVNPAWHLVAPAVWNVRFYFQLRKTFFIFPFIWLWLVFYFFSSFGMPLFSFAYLTSWNCHPCFFTWMISFYLYLFLCHIFLSCLKLLFFSTTWFHAILLNNDIK